MSQHFSLYQDMTIRENIRFYAGIYGLSTKLIKQRGEELIKELKIENYAEFFSGIYAVRLNLWVRVSREACSGHEIRIGIIPSWQVSGGGILCKFHTIR